VERVEPDPHVESILTRGLDNVLVGANTSRLERFRGQLFVFVRNQVTAEGEVVDGRSLPAEIVDTDLGVGDTTVVS
jgi:hypothetical protein